MPITSFDIKTVKAVSRAACEHVPKIMVIAGPNGVGKSTLLYELAMKRGLTKTEGTLFLYQPPHRALRSTQVQRRYTFGGAMRWVRELLAGSEISGYQGLQIINPNRTPDNVDEAGSTIKYSLGRIENRRQAAYSQRIDKGQKAGDKHLDLSELPDVYEPLRTFTEFLLPHLRFEKIDFTNEDDIKCIWQRTDAGGDAGLDLDQLSSGEKAMVTLFVPLLEAEINRLLNKIDAVAGPSTTDDITMIIDEPEQHLHPHLQARVMTYLRRVATQTPTQFIISTHSPTILDQASDDELFVMVPRGIDPSENQLTKVASNLDRLEALRQLTGGSTFVVTTGRSIVCIEGENAGAGESTDIRILELMYPRATAYTFVPVGSKATVVHTVKRLRENLPKEHFKVDVFGITDRDQGPVTEPGVVSWPVCMIENLLLDPALISTAAIELKATGDWSVEAVEKRLAQAVADQREDEIGLRVAKAIGATMIRAKGASVQAIVDGLAQSLQPYEDLRSNPATIQGHVDKATADVQALVDGNTALQRFRGKALLRRVYQAAFPEGAVSYSEFIRQIASTAATHDSSQALLKSLFDGLEASGVA
jgi:energy-coupling factor transporter ATP-binding protein EcfA2